MKKADRIAKVDRGLLYILAFGFIDNLSTRLGLWKMGNGTFYACIIGGGVGLAIAMILTYKGKTTEAEGI